MNCVRGDILFSMPSSNLKSVWLNSSGFHERNAQQKARISLDEAVSAQLSLDLRKRTDRVGLFYLLANSCILMRLYAVQTSVMVLYIDRTSISHYSSLLAPSTHVTTGDEDVCTWSFKTNSTRPYLFISGLDLRILFILYSLLRTFIDGLLV